MKKFVYSLLAVGLSMQILAAQTTNAGKNTADGELFKINEKGYFNYCGVDAMSFNDFYPEGHQGGVSLIMHGKRVVTNGDIRFEPTPGQWQPLPKMLGREIIKGGNGAADMIQTKLMWPDSSKNLVGFNPMLYPDCKLTYTVSLTAKGKGFEVVMDLDSPVPEEFLGKVGFNLEFFPGELFGKPWLMDDKSGIFPQQPNGPVDMAESYVEHGAHFAPKGAKLTADLDLLNSGYDYSPYTADEIVSTPYAVGKCFTSRPDDPYSRLTITSFEEPLKLYDGRMNHNNGWFVLRSEIARGKTKGAVRWYIEPSVVETWLYKPVVQTSQVGYAPAQQKVAVIELDSRDSNVLPTATLVKYASVGEVVVKEIPAKKWEGDFLRYNYLQADFSDVTEPGMYKIRYGESESSAFRIADDVYSRGVWQPVIEYFLPVQMCHMKVMEKYRVWHGCCHMDDGPMAVPGNYIDGYVQHENAYGKVAPGEIAHGIAVGGWHDAGDFDLRIESQIGECEILTHAYEFFSPELNVTSIDQKSHHVEIHQPDGKNDILQQIEHGALSVVNAYLALGRNYRGIIAHTLRQYVHLGDAASMTDGKLGTDDDRWVYTEDNPGRDISTARSLAATYRALRGFNDTLANHCLAIAEDIFENVSFGGNEKRTISSKIPVAIQLYRSTGKQQYFDFVIDNWDMVVGGIRRTAPQTAHFAKSLEGNKKYKKQVKAYRDALVTYKEAIDKESAQTPYGVPYQPSIWGAGWSIKGFGYSHYFLVDAYPDIFAPDQVYSALNFVLGCHPGVNTQSFASGVGAESATVEYGLNRADWSYIPGGVVSGTALIRPDFPELLVWPYLWQQVEYVLGGGSSHYMFLVLASEALSKK